jgi:hypothetical protein
MYEPEKILVQNAGIDPGVAAYLLVVMENLRNYQYQLNVQ